MEMVLVRVPCFEQRGFAPAPSMHAKPDWSFSLFFGCCNIDIHQASAPHTKTVVSGINT